MIFSGMLVGCKEIPRDDLCDEQALVDQWRQESHTENGIVEFTAHTFAQPGFLSFMYSINVKVNEDKIYINDVLYDKIEYLSNPDITFEQDFHKISENGKVLSEEDISETLEKIKLSKNCYMLKTENADTLSESIAVYDLDGIYYFLSFYKESTVLRIHYIKSCDI